MLQGVGGVGFSVDSCVYFPSPLASNVAEQQRSLHFSSAADYLAGPQRQWNSSNIWQVWQSDRRRCKPSNIFLPCMMITLQGRYPPPSPSLLFFAFLSSLLLPLAVPLIVQLTFEPNRWLFAEVFGEGKQMEASESFSPELEAGSQEDLSANKWLSHVD